MSKSRFSVLTTTPQGSENPAGDAWVKVDYKRSRPSTSQRDRQDGAALGKREQVTRGRDAAGTTAPGKWVDVKVERRRDGPMPDEYRARDLGNRYVIPETEPQWIRSIGAILNSSYKIHEIESKVRERAKFYVDNYFSRSKADEVQTHVWAILFHLTIKKDNVTLLISMMTHLSQKTPPAKFIDVKDFLVNSVWNKYAPLHDAAYNTASESFKQLLIWGADHSTPNFKGETVDMVLDAGEKNMMAKHPEMPAVIRNKVMQCRNFLAQWRKNNADKPPQDFDMQGLHDELGAASKATAGGSAEGAALPNEKLDASRIAEMNVTDVFRTYVAGQAADDAVPTLFLKQLFDVRTNVIKEWLFEALDSDAPKKQFDAWAALMRRLIANAVIANADVLGVLECDEMLDCLTDFPFVRDHYFK